jgi:GNAT superfamily N-acetyltransferase|tara:strand:+ start:16275 stop:16874 length:600 start_codon:yes stop_codon:yes gene_type:complete
MDVPPNIRNADLNDLDTLVDTLSDSFTHDPMFNWVFPRTQLYPFFFHMLVRDVYLPRGIVHTEESGRAAALWLPPEERFELAPRLGLLRLGLKLIRHDGLRPVWRVYQQGSVFARHHPAEPHYYLQFLGCRQSSQGQGIGAELLKRGTTVCDSRGMPAYLESSNPRNVPLYERHGFEIRAQQAIGENGPTVWFMWREPR